MNSRQTTNRSNYRWFVLAAALAVVGAVLFSMKAAPPAKHGSPSAQVVKPADHESTRSKAVAAAPGTAPPSSATPDDTTPREANADADTLGLQLD